MRPRPLAAAVAAWVLGATASVAVGLLALGLVGEDLRETADLPITADAASVHEPSPSATAATVPSAPVSTPPNPSAAPDSYADTRLTSAGGDVVARCTVDGAYLVYWSPAPGFKAEDVVRGPVAQARLAFESLTREIKLAISCATGMPVLRVIEDEPRTANT